METPKSSRRISDKIVRDLSHALGRMLEMNDGDASENRYAPNHFLSCSILNSPLVA